MPSVQSSEGSERHHVNMAERMSVQTVCPQDFTKPRLAMFLVRGTASFEYSAGACTQPWLCGLFTILMTGHRSGRIFNVMDLFLAGVGHAYR
jgi:hypothetical protein